MTKEDILIECQRKTDPYVGFTYTDPAILKAMDEWAIHHVRLAFQAGYRLAAKHETNQPDDALELEDYIKKMFPATTGI